jgi:nitrogen regulatory protein P-II 1
MTQLVTAIIKPHRLDAVKEALQSAGHLGMTVTEVRGFGRQGGHTETYRGAEYSIDFLPKLKLEVLIDAADAESVVAMVSDAARTGQIGDGKIWVTTVDAATRIRTGEKGADAI